MSLDGFLTFLTLIAALYALAPAATRLAIRLRSITAILISVIAFTIVLYLLLFETFGRPCPLPRYCSMLVFDPPRTIGPAELAFLVVLLWLLLAVLRLARPKLSVRALPGLARSVAELADEQRYGELIKIVEPNLLLIDRAATRALRLQQISDTLRRWHPTRARIEDIIARLDAGEKSRSGDSLKSLIARMLSPIAPKGEKSERAAEEILRRVMRAPPIIDHIARFRPDFGVRLASLSARGVHDFTDAYLGSLIAEPGSSLYEEIADSQNIGQRGYWISDRNRLLQCLFYDASRAEKLGVWKPIGEAAIAKLRSDLHPEYAARLNGSAEDIDQERWRDPTFVSIRFFDIMVRAALYQGVKWHMWLYYMSYLTEALVENYDDTNPAVDRDAEWPIRAAYLIYEIFDCLTAWIKGAESLKDGEHHLTIESTDVEHENGNIPKSAALCAGQCLRILLLAPNVDDKFKGYIASVIFSRLADLPKSGALGQIRLAFLNSVVAGGVLGKNAAYGGSLRDRFDGTDHIVRAKLNDLDTAIAAEYP